MPFPYESYPPMTVAVNALPESANDKRRLGDRYEGLSLHFRIFLECAFAVLVPLLIGTTAFYLTVRAEPVLFTVYFWIILSALLLTTLMITIEVARAARFPEPPVKRALTDDEMPRLAIVVPAYLPNEVDTLMDSLRAQLSMDYPADKFLVVCAYNRDERLDLEDSLLELARNNSCFVPLRVPDSSSKAHNLNAALRHLDGLVDVIAIFDADHQPHPTAARQAVRWLSPLGTAEPYDFVQGQCVIRNSEANFLTKLVAAEFVTIYAVAHPGRTVFNDFGIFGGTNGWWKADLITSLTFDSTMLTEDIDSTARALLRGKRMATDPRIVSTELSPVSFTTLWKQRMRWSQGWLQVSIKYTGKLLRSSNLTGYQKRGVALLFLWRVVHPWIAALMVPLMITHLLLFENTPYDLLIFVFTAILVNGVGAIQAAMAKRLAPPQVRDQRFLFARYAAFSFFYALLRAWNNRGAVLRQILGVDQWEVTTRGTTR